MDSHRSGIIVFNNNGKKDRRLVKYFEHIMQIFGYMDHIDSWRERERKTKRWIDRQRERERLREKERGVRKIER